jgi:ribosomal subunit interface protein
VEIVVTARHTQVPDRLRRHAVEKLAKVEQLAPRAIRLDVEISHERNPRQSSTRERVEITVRDRGPVIRAEACADDPYAAIDVACAKLVERLRRARDRRKVHHGRHNPVSVHDATSSLPSPGADGAIPAAAAGETGEGAGEGSFDGSPVVIREKVHQARPMTLDDALYEMELVGHDFFLFIDVVSRCPSVVYRRRGWDYGVIRLEESAADGATEDDGSIGAEASRAAG